MIKKYLSELIIYSISKNSEKNFRFSETSFSLRLQETPTEKSPLHCSPSLSLSMSSRQAQLLSLNSAKNELCLSRLNVDHILSSRYFLMSIWWMMYLNLRGTHSWDPLTNMPICQVFRTLRPLRALSYNRLARCSLYLAVMLTFCHL